MNRDEILAWLQEQNPERLEVLWERANDVRRENVGDAVHIRGLIEFSNLCRSNCHYCGMRAGRLSLPRYRMTDHEILGSAEEALRRGYGSIVMQSGEDSELDVECLAGVISKIKRQTALTVTLSCGERTPQELVRWREAGADRYFLRFETSDRALWRSIHPRKTQDSQHRLDMLEGIRELGFETGSGIMIGIPGQTWSSLAEDILWFRRLELDMIGSGPYIPHTETPLGRAYYRALPRPMPEQAPNTDLMTYKVMALTRLTCPRVNIPSTTALATLDREHGSEFGLRRGANVLMVNLTPAKYRALYEIYPEKAGISELPSDQCGKLALLLAGLGRHVGEGPGTSPNYEARQRVVSSH